MSTRQTSPSPYRSPASPVSRPGVLQGALAGLLAAATGLAAGELLSGLNRKLTSPVIGVGNRAVDLVPQPLKRFAIRQFGTHDKQALLIGMFAAIAIFAIVVGILATRRKLIGIIGLTAFGALGALAAVTGRTGSLSDALPSILAAVVAIVMLMGLLGAARGTHPNPAAASPGPGSVTTPRNAPDDMLGRIMAKIQDGEPARVTATASAPAVSPAVSRRGFLALSGAAAVAAAGMGTAGRLLQRSTGSIKARASLVLPKARKPLAAAPAGVSVPELNDATPFFTPNNKFYRIDTALEVPKIDVDTWELKIKGMVGQERTYTYEDLLSRNLVERDITLTCVSNEVGGILMGNARWLGVPLKELLDEAEVQNGATQIVGRSVDGWTSGFPTKLAMDGRDAMVAIAMNGEPLPFAHGFPARLIIPGIYGYVSATKWLTEIELTTLEDFDAYWVPRGYAKEAPIKLASRIDVPRGLSTIPAGKAAVAGVAWAQTVGIAKVEVKIDDAEWKEAVLADEQSVDTWRQWHLEWDATTGSHSISVRATDKNGKLQQEDRKAPLPNGATGWHQIISLVS